MSEDNGFRPKLTNKHLKKHEMKVEMSDFNMFYNS